MRCPKCSYENKDDAVACLMCYTMLKPPQGEIKTKPVTPPPSPPVIEETPPPPPKPFIVTEEKPKVTKERISTKEEKGIIGTWWEVISSPAAFFDRMYTAGEFSKAYVFGLITLLIMGLGMFFIMSVGGQGVRNMYNMPNISPGMFSIIGLIILPLFFAVFGSVGLFINAAVLNICSKLLLGKGSYNGTFKVVAYASSINVFMWLPIINILFGLYGLFITIIGLKKVHGFSTGKAILAILMPGLLGLAIAGVIVSISMVGSGK